MTGVYVCLLLTLAIIASQMWNIWLLHKRIQRLEARPECPKEFAVKVITSQIVEDFMSDLADADEDEDDEEAVRH